MNAEIISVENLLSREDKIQDQIDDIILELIKERKKKKMTQIQLSKETGIPQATISRLESFNSVPTLQVLISVSNSLGFSLSLKCIGE